MKYEAQPKGNGEYEVWRWIEGDTTFQKQHIATFHNPPAYSPKLQRVNLAQLNAENFCKEQNEREELLRSTVERFYQSANLKEEKQDGP